MSGQACDLGKIGVIVAAPPARQNSGRCGQHGRQDPLDATGPALANVAKQQRPLPVGVAGDAAAAEEESDAGMEAFESRHAPVQRQFTL